MITKPGHLRVLRGALALKRSMYQECYLAFAYSINCTSPPISAID